MMKLHKYIIVPSDKKGYRHLSASLGLSNNLNDCDGQCERHHGGLCDLPYIYCLSKNIRMVTNQVDKLVESNNAKAR